MNKINLSNYKNIRKEDNIVNIMENIFREYNPASYVKNEIVIKPTDYRADLFIMNENIAIECKVITSKKVSLPERNLLLQSSIWK